MLRQHQTSRKMPVALTGPLQVLKDRLPKRMGKVVQLERALKSSDARLRTVAYKRLTEIRRVKAQQIRLLKKHGFASEARKIENDPFLKIVLEGKK